MQRTSWKLLVVISLLMPAFAHADDARMAAMDDARPDLITLSSRAYWQQSTYASHWRVAESFETGTYPSDVLHPIARLDFRDPGALARVSKVRELSFLTLAEIGKTRFFFGVNNNGLFGLHLGARPRVGDERSIELARLPYLKQTARDGR